MLNYATMLTIGVFAVVSETALFKIGSLSSLLLLGLQEDLVNFPGMMGIARSTRVMFRT